MKKTSKKAGFEFSSDVFDLPPEKNNAAFLRRLWLVNWTKAGLFPRAVPKRIKISMWFPDIFSPLAKSFGLADESNESLIRNHYKRLSLRIGLYFIIMMPLAYILLILSTFGFGYFFITWAVKSNAEWLLSSVGLLIGMISIFALFVFFFLPIEYTLIRIFFLMLDQLFADTLCVRASLGVLVELASPQALKDPLRKRILLAYINDLARCAQLLYLTFGGSSDEENDKLRQRFRALESFIREQGRMAVFSTADTLDSLRNNFMMLTQMFINGTYGDFKPQEDVVQPVPEKPLPWYRVLTSGIGRVIGVGLPMVGLYFLIFHPGYFSNIPFDTNILTTVSLGWLVLSVDSAFGLGVTSKVIATARELRDLV